MEEPILKKKNIIRRIFKSHSFITISTALLLIITIIASSYAAFNNENDSESKSKDIIVQSGNLFAKITSNSGQLEIDNTTLESNNDVGDNLNPYSFTIKNHGESRIAYYELRIIDKEHEISTLSHKSINYSLSVNNSEYSKPQNLGNNRSYIYVGGSLEPNEHDTFDLKVWVNNELKNKEKGTKLKASIELTLYGDIPTRNYIIYDTQGGNYVSKTSIVSRRVTSIIPIKDGYVFLGWSSEANGSVEYEVNDIYNVNQGTILYAIWEKKL